LSGWHTKPASVQVQFHLTECETSNQNQSQVHDTWVSQEGQLGLSDREWESELDFQYMVLGKLAQEQMWLVIELLVTVMTQEQLWLVIEFLATVMAQEQLW
jgi:hypothetical protein